MNALLPLFSLAYLSLHAQEIRTTCNDRVALSATFYQNGLAVVRDTRRVDLPAGRSRLAFADLHPTLRPKSATLLDPGQGVEVLERNFEFDLLSPASLTNGSLRLPAWPRWPWDSWDKTGVLASLPFLHPRLRIDADPLARIARLPRAFIQPPDGNVVVETGDGFQPANPGELAFTQVPPSLRATPTLLQDLSAETPGPRDLTLLYSATDLTWTASYVATLDTDGEHLDLDVFATVENLGDGPLPETMLQLVAGKPNIVPDEPPRDPDVLGVDQTTVECLATAIAGPPVFKEEKVSEYPLFSLDRPVSIPGHSKKQLVLMKAVRIPVTPSFLIESPYEDYAGDGASNFLDSPLFQPEPENPKFCPLPYLEGGPDQNSEEFTETWENVQFLGLQHREWMSRHHPPVQRIGVIQNHKASNLGRALPEGSLDLRYRDPAGLELPLTEAMGAAETFPQTPPREAVELVMGNARGFQVDRHPTQKRVLHANSSNSQEGGNISWVYTIELKIASRLATASQVTVREPLSADWKLLEATHQGSRSGSTSYDFRVHVPAHGSATLRYTVRTAPKPALNQE